MTETIAVVRPRNAIRDAYIAGYDRFRTSSTGVRSPDGLSAFMQTATWANVVLPNLRSMAGYADSAGGTYTTERQVAAIHPGCEEDTPADADLVDSKRVYDVLVDAFKAGAYDGMVRAERDPSCVTW